MKKLFVLLLTCLISRGSPLCAQTAMEIAPDMYPGWNLGNTLEAGPCNWLSNPLDWETGWQKTRTSQEVIDYVKSLGFRSIRIPVSWYMHMDSKYNIDKRWMKRVREIVDYCMNADLYVLLNDHFDNGWADKSFFGASEEQIAKNCDIMTKMWTQIAEAFAGYDNRLLFAGMNEPNVEIDEADVLIRMEQAFVDAVRATGGNNTRRILVTQAPMTNIEKAYEATILPTDPTPNAMMLEVHFYEPYRFVMMNEDAGWGYRAFYWGQGNHVDGSVYNASEGSEETYVSERMKKMKKKYTSQGIPVIIGEYSADWRVMPEGEDQEKHDASVATWYRTVCRYAINNGCIPMNWDVNGCGRPSCSVVNRSTLEVHAPHVLSAIMEGCAKGKWPFERADGLETLPKDMSDDVVCDLSGRRIHSAPSRGFYIRNGRKYYLK